MTQIASAPLVGAHFHPPAKALLSLLRTGQNLELVREPQNPYDENAIQVMLPVHDLDAVASDELEQAVSGYGFSAADIMATDLWPLGHIAAKTGEAAALAPELDAGKTPRATLAFGGSGSPIVKLEWDQ